MLTDIHRLIEKYFEGQTSSGEEKMLRDYFAQPGLPDDLKEYAPLFRFLDNESKAIAVLNGIRLDDEAAVRRRQSLRKYGTIAAVAASLFIALILLTPETSSTSQKGNYVWVDGKRITDSRTVREYAELSFDKVQPENDIIADQLRAFSE